ncbi:phosphatidate cytidylyltransferase [Jatrophihabitans sp. DSM 45814]
MARRNSDDPADNESVGRHGGASGTGLSAAELIARARADNPPFADQPNRSARRAAEQAEAIVEREAAAAEEPSVRRHLAVVDSPVPMAVESTAAIAEDKKSRAGRNLPAAIAVGAALGALILLTLFLYRPSFVIVVGIAAALGVYEMVTAISTVEARPPLLPLLVGGVAMEAIAWFRGPDGLVGALLLTVLGILIWRLADGASGYFADVASATLVSLYVPFLAGFAALLAHPDDGAARIVIFILAVVCSDTGGYVAGVLIGKHPMAPMVSPKKSWEGFGGSILASSACGVLMMVFCFHQDWWKGVAFGVVIAVTATLGDLGESMIKRDLGLKDMGKLLPGHGGIMDRLDSLLPCAPIAYLLLVAFLR